MAEKTISGAVESPLEKMLLKHPAPWKTVKFAMPDGNKRRGHRGYTFDHEYVDIVDANGVEILRGPERFYLGIVEAVNITSYPIRTGGLWNQLTPEQQAAAMAYDGPVGSGSRSLPAIKRPTAPSQGISETPPSQEQVA